jgi:diguanylate cyclase (GGDEF)-like protein
MYTWLRILIVQDTEDDARRIVRDLQRAGFELTWERITTAPAMANALDHREWDLVIGDAALCGISGIDVMTLLREHGLDVPCVLTTRDLRRLVPDVERQLRDAERRRAQRSVTARAEHLVSHDAVTLLPNRGLLDDTLRQALASAHRARHALALLMLDVEDFKDINSTLGHTAGDTVLRHVGRRIQRALRDTDTIARLGNDEFAVVLPGSDADRAVRVVRRILESLEGDLVVEDATLDVRASVGIALYPAHATTSHRLIQRASAAMSAAKTAESRFSMYAPEADRQSRQRLTLSRELKIAIETQQLVWHYQPKVDLRNKKVLGFEILAYWLHPTERLLPPGRFIGVAERTGLIRGLTLKAIESGLNACGQWQAVNVPAIVAVNLSPKTLKDERFPDDVGLLLEASGLTPSSLELEITESVMMTDQVKALATLERLREMGIRLSIDDFGTGYASLNYLRTLPVQELKIDRSFVADLARHGNVMIVRSMIDLAHNLGLTVVAEGVESGDVWDQLVALDCNAAQGFFISRPVPYEAMAAWLSKWHMATRAMN